MKVDPDCEVCGKKPASFVCSGCASAQYCSKGCQLSHWSEHKMPCKEAAASKKERARQEALLMETLAENDDEEEEKEKEEEARKAKNTTVTNPPCAMCGVASFETCTNCMATHYCSKACQVKHWSVHKIPCKESPIYKANQELAALKKKLAAQEQALGVDHEETLRTVNVIGNFLGKQKKFKEAEVYYRRALEGLERTLGPDHPITLISVGNMSTQLQGQGKFSLAEPC